ncbi:MAG: hypothetical protein P4L50_27545 [Anaerolineaceae bacterium]|nr:hypothetical protein [Anaerolineaceae bacterium]
MLIFVKQKLPAPIDNILAGGNMPDVAKGIGGLFSQSFTDHRS